MLNNVKKIWEEYQELEQTRKIYVNCFNLNTSLELKEQLIGRYISNNEDLIKLVKNHMESKVKSLEEILQDKNTLLK
jgi:thymidylate synthase ThyX